MQTELLTVAEYAETTNEKPSDVIKRVEIAEQIHEFLTHIGMSGQYHVAREYQVYSLFSEMLNYLKKLDGEDKTTLQHLAFNNAILKAVPDQRKFIRNIKTLIQSGTYQGLFKAHAVLDQELHNLCPGSRSASKRILTPLPD